MNKLFKKVSALVLAGAMTLSSSVSVFAANMNIYVREYNQDKNGNIAYYPENKTPLVTIETVPGESIYDAIQKATENGLVESEWTTVTNKDETVDQYLEMFGVGDFSRENWGEYSNLTKDESGNTHGTWAGSSWMWLSGGAESLGSFNYPEETLSDFKCPSSDFSIILSFDYSSFSW